MKHRLNLRDVFQGQFVEKNFHTSSPKFINEMSGFELSEVLKYLPKVESNSLVKSMKAKSLYEKHRFFRSREPMENTQILYSLT
jgi:hypothetical protein